MHRRPRACHLNRLAAHVYRLSGARRTFSIIASDRQGCELCSQYQHLWNELTASERCNRWNPKTTPSIVLPIFHSRLAGLCGTFIRESLFSIIVEASRDLLMIAVCPTRSRRRQQRRRQVRPSCVPWRIICTSYWKHKIRQCRWYYKLAATDPRPLLDRRCSS